MKKFSDIFSLREVIIAACVAIAIIVLGGFVDLSFTKSVYDPINTHMFGVVLAGICELPVCLTLCFGGIGLIMGRVKTKKWLEILCIVVGIIAIGVGAYFLFDTAKDWYSFKNTESFKTGAIILGVALAILIPAAVVLFGIFKLKNVDKRKLLIISIALLLICLTIAILSNVGKYLWSRPRPRYIFRPDINDESLFHPIYQLDPFGCLRDGFGGRRNYQSFPSGHTTYASTAIWILPLSTLLFDKTKNNRILQISLFYFGLAYTVMSGLSRVYAGAHFLSDTGAGLLVGILGGVIAYLVMRPVSKAIESKGETINENA